MQKNRRFSLLVLPQFFDGGELGLNIAVLPRNQNPLAPAIEQHPAIPDAPAFADAQLSFRANIVSGTEDFPNSLSATSVRPLATTTPTKASDLFTALKNQFDIHNPDPTNRDLTTNPDAATNSAPMPASQSVRKYLPQTYRKAFNFTTPRTKNATTDDGYHCAVRNAEFVPGFKRSPDTVSWGKVFAYALRQPLLARQLGMIYTTKIAIVDSDFPEGGWLFVDLATDSDYKAQQQADDTFVARYAARIPALKTGSPRSVFAPLLIPVLYKAKAADPDPLPEGHYDELLIEAAAYDDGFGKVVHAFQPPSLNLLSEESDGAHPVNDVGIRLGWDDEQILIWYMRQMMIDPSVSSASDQRIDAPLAVFGYAVDVREVATPEKKWESLNGVVSKAPLELAEDQTPAAHKISLGRFSGELPYQVYPIQLDGDGSKNYWLPMYFANWTGGSLVLPDEEAAAIYQTDSPTVKADPLTSSTGTGVSGPAKNQMNKLFNKKQIKTVLEYGRSYQFRVRFRDLSGGGVSNDDAVKPIDNSPSNIARCHFKRYVTPNQVRVKDLSFNVDHPITNVKKLTVHRPLLGYPAVAYAGKYADPIALLRQASIDMVGKEAFGIEDPDVDRIEIMVEVQTLRMDNLLSASGKDNYVLLYKTTRAFSPVKKESDYRSDLPIPVIFKDCKVLHVGDELDLAGDLGLPDAIDKLKEIVLPSARTIRLTLRAVCEDKTNNSDYYGLINAADPDLDTRFGRTVQISLYQPSKDETDLFINASSAQTLQGVYLQPDRPTTLDRNFLSVLLGKQMDRPPDIVERLAKQLNLGSTGLTILGNKGERVQFGCSNKIRHALAPESSSLAFSSKSDLMNHWLSCITFDLNRDWTWNALDSRSFLLTRTLRFTHDDGLTETEVADVGDIEIRHTASFEALQASKRDYTRVIFIDAIDPKNPRMQPTPHQMDPRFPDTIEVHYEITPQFKVGHGAQNDGNTSFDTRLPITTPPSQVPKITSAGIALSPYQRNEKYSATEPRQRYLWIEFDEAIADPQDTFFARVLAYAPDQLISNNHPELLIAPEEPALPIDPEYIRVIPPNTANDLAGLNAMQPMEKASDSDVHYLLPIPPGLHPDAPEMFGFFTYEFRVGHYRDKNTNEMSWCTAQGRFGRPLRCTGIQHPAPTLTCAVNRDEEKLYVVAPYAVAVLDGKDYTANPPRTDLRCLLYAQVHQADNKDFRNILLDDKQLDWRVQIELQKNVDWLNRYTRQQLSLLKKLTIRNSSDDLSYARAQHIFKLTELSSQNLDATKYGTAAWSNDEIEQLLRNYGLPITSPLSVLVVEMLPTLTNIRDAVTKSRNVGVANSVSNALRGMNIELGRIVNTGTYVADAAVAVDEGPSPLGEELGEHRILRTSPLTEVPYVC